MQPLADPRRTLPVARIFIIGDNLLIRTERTAAPQRQYTWGTNVCSSRGGRT